MIRRACALAACCALVAHAASAAAGASGVDLAAGDCPQVHAEEVDRVLAIELGSVSGAWSGDERLRAELSCDASHLSIAVVDPVTDKRLTRSVAMDWRTGDRDRTVALLVSQLFLTSWSELLLARSAARELPAPPRPPPPAVEHAAEEAVRSALPPADVRGALTLAVGPRVRDMASPVVGFGAALRPSLLFGRSWRLFLDIDYERGSADRAQGTVVYSLAAGALGGGWRASFGALALEVDLRAGAAYVDLRGDASAGAVGSAASGAVAEVALDAGPSLALGPARIGLLATAGLTGPRVVAHSTGDRDVSIGGPWLGASLVGGLAEPGP